MIVWPRRIALAALAAVVPLVLAPAAVPAPARPQASSRFEIMTSGIGDVNFAKRTVGTVGPCTAGALVEVRATIAGGTAGNSIVGRATCTSDSRTTVAKTPKAADTGGDTPPNVLGTGSQVSGDPDCRGKYTTVGPDVFASGWIVRCSFY